MSLTCKGRGERSWCPTASQDNRLEVGLHYTLYAQLPGNSVQFVEIEALAAPCLRERFERHIEANLVSESKAVSNGASEAVDANDRPRGDRWQ